MDRTLLEQLMELTEEEKEILKGNQEVNREIYTGLTSNFVVQSEKLLNDDLIMIRKHPRYIHFPKHSHDFIEMNYVYHGTFEQQIGDQVISLEQGDILLLNQYVEHELKACNTEDIVINFIIHPAFFDSILPNIASGTIQTQMVHFLFNSMFDYNQQAEFLFYPLSGNDQISEMMDQLIQTMNGDSLFARSKIKFLMGLLLIELMEQQPQSQALSEEQKFLQTVFEYIEEEYKNANLEDLAKIVNQTSYGVSRKIKTLTNKNFKDLLQEKRLTMAKHSLLYSDLPIQTIAEEVGYENISYFYRIFKKKYGMTPKAYQSSMK
ncbi:AraC-like DNA-binding protein/mannose-6-phosphate isomerase-like protein (cupin superfamily) [Gracilibacillus halotolerans]|uniref:AraC-like DNA-binding protein/mannose-6-phosphate isomerase-like protein (Cupin superfamily) n=1 Tax=Gracilibacillus halotolerans TaxID=74386 RepID=A0A841RGH0_9BACI|nr:AraC family transcriptional regulator [Gracilibacillus halotolerans]MBB6511569.1 AraC-like DNA-binding protein/mannose-6-phosphate isomerase-like protein (cupin superfamily) [Gracilibacillus halotolerans]